jgi:hypothetical protein
MIHRCIMVNNTTWTTVRLTAPLREKVGKYVERMHKNDETKLEFLSIPNFVSYVLNKEMKA